MRARAGAWVSVVAAVAILSGCPRSDPSPAETGDGDGVGAPGDAATAVEVPGDRPPEPAAGERRAERTAVRLGPNLPLARIERRGGLFVPAGTAGLAKYLRFGSSPPRWTLGQTQDTVPVARPGRVAALQVPLTATQAAAEALYLGVHAPAEVRVAVKVGGRKAGAVTLAPGWQVARVPVVEDRLVEGENVIAFEIGGRPGPGPALAWLRIGGGSPAPIAVEGAPGGAGDHGEATDGEAKDEAKGEQAKGEQAKGEQAKGEAKEGDVQGRVVARAAPVRYLDGADTLLLGRDAGLVYYLYVPARAHLVAAVEGDGCEVAVRAEAELGDATGPSGEGGVGIVHGLWSGSVTPAAGAAEGGLRSSDDQTETPARARRPAEQRVDLASLAGKVARLTLTASGCERTRLRAPRLTVAGAPIAHDGGAPPRHVVVWLMSGLRADRVRPFSPWARPEVPGFERLAATGAVFSPTWAQDSATEAARAALWTGRYPIRAEPGEDDRSARERRAARERRRVSALGSEMRSAGFHTLAFTADMERSAGFADGFATFTRVPGPDPRTPAPGAEVLARAMAEMGARQAEKPVFLVLQTADSRLPWTGHEPWLSRYDPGAYEGPFANAARPADLGATVTAATADRVLCGREPDERALTRLRAIYDATVSYQDALLVQLVDQLAQWGVLEQTLIVVTSDHGQELWEDGRCGHGASLRESLLGVPLLLHHPGLVPGGRVFRGGAEAIDVLPTIQRALGLTAPPYVQGQSLLERARRAEAKDVGDADDAVGYPRPMFAARGDLGHAVRLANWKLMVGANGAQALFDLAADPTEQRNLAAARPTERRLLADLLALHRLYRARWNKRVWGVPGDLTVEGWRQLEGRGP